MIERFKQTLAEWSALHPRVHVNSHGVARVIADQQLSGRVDRWGLWHLRDYVVSSVTGGSVWLVPR